MLCNYHIRKRATQSRVEMKDVVALVECPKMWEMFRSVANDSAVHHLLQVHIILTQYFSSP